MKIVAKPIDVYILHMHKENPMPRRFRIEEEDDFKTIHVNKIVSVEKTKRAGADAFIYRCQSVIDGIEKQYELRYKIVECKWDLYKI